MSTPIPIHLDLSYMYEATRLVLVEAAKLARLAHGTHPPDWSPDECACAAAPAAVELREQLVNARKMVKKNEHLVRAAYRALNLPAALMARLVNGIYSSAHEAATEYASDVNAAILEQLSDFLGGTRAEFIDTRGFFRDLANALSFYKLMLPALRRFPDPLVGLHQIMVMEVLKLNEAGFGNDDFLGEHFEPWAPIPVDNAFGVTTPAAPSPPAPTPPPPTEIELCEMALAALDHWHQTNDNWSSPAGERAQVFCALQDVLIPLNAPRDTTLARLESEDNAELYQDARRALYNLRADIRRRQQPQAPSAPQLAPPPPPPPTAAPKADPPPNLVSIAAALVETETRPTASVNGDDVLSEKEAAVDAVIRSVPPPQAITGPAIIDRLSEKGIEMCESTLTSHIVPKLKRLRGLKNQPKRGYYYPAKK